MCTRFYRCANNVIFVLVFFFFYHLSNNYTTLLREIAFFLEIVILVLGILQHVRLLVILYYNQFVLRHFFWCFCYHCKLIGPFCYVMSKLLLSWYLIIRDEKLISDAVIIRSRYNEIVVAMWSRHSGASFCDANKMRTTSKLYCYMCVCVCVE